MAGVKRPVRRLYGRRTKRTFRRQLRKRLRFYSPRKTSFMLSRTGYGGSWTFSTASTSGFWKYYQFTPGAINNWAELAQVFDEVKINGIKVTFRPAFDSVTAPAAAGALVQPEGYAHVVVDPASTLNPSGAYGSTTLNTLMENAGVKSYPLNKPFSVYFKPEVVVAMGGGSTFAQTKRCPWLRTNDGTVGLTGFHVYLQQNNFSTGNSNIVLDAYVTYYCQFRNPK